MTRLGSKADVIVSELAMELFIGAAEDGTDCIALGKVREDEPGKYYELRRIGMEGVSLLSRNEEGSTSPGEGLRGRFPSMFPNGVPIG